MRGTVEVCGDTASTRAVFGAAVGASENPHRVPIKETLGVFFATYLSVCDALSTCGTLRRVAQAVAPVALANRERGLGSTIFNPLVLLSHSGAAYNDLECAGLLMIAGDIDRASLVGHTMPNGVVLYCVVWEECDALEPSTVLSAFRRSPLELTLAPQAEDSYSADTTQTLYRIEARIAELATTEDIQRALKTFKEEAGL